MIRKVFVRILIAVVVLFFAITALGLWGPKVASWWRGYKYSVELEKAEMVAKSIEEAYKSDRDGGKTPEETIDMFLQALEKKEVRKASKYYELSVQPKAFESLKKELGENGNLQRSLNYFMEVKSVGIKECNKNGDGCTFEYRGADGYKRFFDVYLNQNTSAWKITQPY